jgi:hypothetical protein
VTGLLRGTVFLFIEALLLAAPRLGAAIILPTFMTLGGAPLIGWFGLVWCWACIIVSY